MEEFITNFNEFRDFLFSKSTEFTLSTMTKDGGMTLKVIRDKFNELGLNKSF